jgi:serine/threonine protein kinase
MEHSTDLDELCPGCFSSASPERLCPRCGYAGETDRLALPVLTELQGGLVIGRLLGKPGGFGVTYLGWDRVLKRRVAIKEYLPRELAGRHSGDCRVQSHTLDEEVSFRYGLEKFLQEARILAEMDHPSVVRVQRFLEENGTAYLVMDYHEGASLDRYLADCGGRLPEREAVAILLPILEALAYIHGRGYVHRDVKPSNLYLRKDGRASILLDFGAARTALGERTRNVSALLSPGYSPLEQYNFQGQLGPWTDVYASAATLYRAVTGVGPPDANGRLEEDRLIAPDLLVPGLSPRLCEALLSGLALRRQDRLQSVKVFLQALTNTEMAEVVGVPSAELRELWREEEPVTALSISDGLASTENANYHSKSVVAWWQDISIPDPPKRPRLFYVILGISAVLILFLLVLRLF